MAAENDFLAFATGAGAAVQSQAAYAASAALSTGFQVGIADPTAVNKALRQATFVAAAIATFIVNETGDTALDDGNLSEFVTNLTAAITAAGSGGVANASTSVAGKSPLATNAQALALADTTHVLTPSNLAALLASTSQLGIVALASNAQTLALTDATHAVTPAGLGALDASTSQQGLIATATDSQALAESLNSVALVPSNLAALFANSASSFGYQKLPGGLIIQWGFQSMGDDTLATFTLPTTFLSGAYAIVGAVQSASAITAGNGGGFIGNLLTTSQVAIGQAWSSSSAGTGVWFICVGK